MAGLRFARAFSGVVAAALCAAAAAGTIEELEANRFLLLGAIDEDTKRQCAASISDGARLTVLAWGHSVEAWLMTAELSEELKERGVEVEIEYAEDAAICLHGAKTEISGRVLADNSVPSFSPPQRQRIASALDRFHAVCAARIPREAPAQSPTALVGRAEKGRGKSAARRWYFTRTGEHSRGDWRHEEVEKITRMVEKARADVERKARLLRSAAEARKRRGDAMGRKDAEERTPRDPAEDSPEKPAER